MIEYWVIEEHGTELKLTKVNGYREAMDLRKRLKQETPGLVVRIEMRR